MMSAKKNSLFKPLLNSFNIFLKQIYDDAMLVAVFVAPILAGLVFKFLIPFLGNKFGFIEYIRPYFQIFDIFLCQLTPYMFCFASSLVVLGEIDENITFSMYVSPLGKPIYLVSRFLIPAFIGFIATVVLLELFNLSKPDFASAVVLSLLSAITTVLPALLIICIANNRVEGMALAKMSGIGILTAVLPFFLDEKVWRLFGFLPFIWVSRFVQTGSLISVVLCLITSAFWFVVLWKRFEKKI